MAGVGGLFVKNQKRLVGIQNCPVLLFPRKSGMLMPWTLTKFFCVPENGETPTSPVRTAAEGSKKVPTAMTTKLENTGLTYLLRA